MKQEEVIERLKEELNLPFFNGTLEEKNYSEADYQLQNCIFSIF